MVAIVSALYITQEVYNGVTDFFLCSCIIYFVVCVGHEHYIQRIVFQNSAVPSDLLDLIDGFGHIFAVSGIITYSFSPISIKRGARTSAGCKAE